MISSVSKVKSQELLRIARQCKYVEASLNNGFLNATHLLRYGGRKYYDTGIDSQETSWSACEFINFYKESYWKIDKVIM